MQISVENLIGFSSLLIVIIGGFSRQENRMTKLETKMEHHAEMEAELVQLRTQNDGLRQDVALLKMRVFGGPPYGTAKDGEIGFLGGSVRSSSSRSKGGEADT